MPEDELFDFVKQRAELIKRLMKALEHLSREHQYAVLCSWMSMDELEKLVRFQER